MTFKKHNVKKPWLFWFFFQKNKGCHFYLQVILAVLSGFSCISEWKISDFFMLFMEGDFFPNCSNGVE